MNKLFSVVILSLIFTLSSCSKPASPRTFKLVLSSLTAAGVEGGALIKLINSSTKEELLFRLKAPPYEVDIPNGTWDIFAVGFSGPTLWQGTNYCGNVAAKVLDGNATDITINATEANCLISPYPALIALLSSWDSALWDQARWSP